MSKNTKKLSRSVASLKRQSLKLSTLNSLSGKSISEIALGIKRSSSGFLYSKEWVNLRKSVLDSYGTKCMKCGTLPSKKNPANVDHIKPRKLFPDLALEFSNLQVLCGKCNKEKGNKNQIDYRISKLTSPL
jgi:5-methylcytosine-specific restriction endonuclease McrA